MTKYRISELFATIQGEGSHVGRPCVLLRFQGCNLWTDQLKKSKVCPFCDTEQLHSGVEIDEQILFNKLIKAKPSPDCGLMLTGGEPMLQLNDAFVSWASNNFKWVDIETNGTVKEPFSNAPWRVVISCSPKCSGIKLTYVHQFKLLVPDKLHLLPEIKRMAGFNSASIFIQPVEVGGLNSAKTIANTKLAVELCMKEGYTLSLQMHKYAGIK